MIKLKKIVAFETDKFLQRKKFSKEIYGLKLSNLEILALVNYHEFGIFEKIIQRKKILVRVDGSNEIGLGHVYNMLIALLRRTARRPSPSAMMSIRCPTLSWQTCSTLGSALTRTILICA